MDGLPATRSPTGTDAERPSWQRSTRHRDEPAFAGGDTRPTRAPLGPHCWPTKEVPTRWVGTSAEPLVGFEPTTTCLQDRCSGQLSYRGGPSGTHRTVPPVVTGQITDWVRLSPRRPGRRGRALSGARRRERPGWQGGGAHHVTAGTEGAPDGDELAVHATAPPGPRWGACSGSRVPGLRQCPMGIAPGDSVQRCSTHLRRIGWPEWRVVDGHGIERFHGQRIRGNRSSPVRLTGLLPEAERVTVARLRRRSG